MTLFALAAVFGLLAVGNAACVRDGNSENCCTTIHYPSNNSACANFTYNPNTVELTVSLEVDNHLLFNKTFAAQDPPPLCEGVIYKDALCIHFGRVNASRHGVCACADAVLYLAGFLVWDVPFGCFDFGQCVLAPGVGCGVSCTIDSDCDPNSGCSHCDGSCSRKASSMDRLESFIRQGWTPSRRGLAP
eukprot:TRINITY_DN45327_c0_g1_i1.p1 TRINITY_DN45327_c0_g1~~TRINITY_DN45327_c0_g1_i1.p1  ORF type:complete len:189 (+),score=6.06 TRINITY_DN45327_c0_g1_i1:164-730(+)